MVSISSSSWPVYHQQIISLEAQKNFIIFFHNSWGGVIGIKAMLIMVYVKILLFFVKNKNKKLTHIFLENKLNDHVTQHEIYLWAWWLDPQVVILRACLRSVYFAESTVDKGKS